MEQSLWEMMGGKVEGRGPEIVSRGVRGEVLLGGFGIRCGDGQGRPFSRYQWRCGGLSFGLFGVY